MKFIKLTALLLLSSLSAIANANLISIDYLDEGDSLAIHDVTNGQDWLSLLATDGQSVNATLARIESGELEGWRLPTYDEMIDMITSFYDDRVVDPVRSFDISSDESSNWYELFGQTYSDRSAGYFARTNGTYGVTGAFSDYMLGLNYNKYLPSAVFPHYGTYLIADAEESMTLDAIAMRATASTSVPLPATVVLLGLGLLGFGVQGSRETKA